jgi:hypothetical protein
LVSLPIANTPNNTAAPSLLPIWIFCTFADLQFGQVIFLLLFGCPQLGQEFASIDICLPHALQLTRDVGLAASVLLLAIEGGEVATERTGVATTSEEDWFGTFKDASQLGQFTTIPAPASSIAICCPHLLQSNVMSMPTPLVAAHPSRETRRRF